MAALSRRVHKIMREQFLTRVYDSGRDSFLLNRSSRPPSGWDSIEYLGRDVHYNTTISSNVSSYSKRSATASSDHNTGRSCRRSSTTTHSEERSNCSNSRNDRSNSHRSSNGSMSDSTATRANDSSWSAELTGTGSRAGTAPGRSTMRNRNNIGVPSALKTPAGAPKKFFWGPKVARERQKIELDVRRTNHGEAATFALAVEECSCTVSTIRSVVSRGGGAETLHGGLHDDATHFSSAYAAMEPYIRTSITDRAHDGTYDTDTAHKATIAGRVVKGRGGNILAPDLSCGGKQRPLERGVDAAAKLATQDLHPGQYDLTSGIDATSISTTYLSLPRKPCTYDSYIRSSLGQTTGSHIGPGNYDQLLNKSHVGTAAFSAVDRWPKPTSSNKYNFSNRGPWDDVEDAWGKGGYIERSVPRDCASYLPVDPHRYMTTLDVDHLNKATFNTVMRCHPRRYAASFSSTQKPDWRVVGNPTLGPGTYRIERAERLTLPAPSGGEGDADPSRPSTSFRACRSPFDVRRLAADYKTLKPRFSTPRLALYASELPFEQSPILAAAGTTKGKGWARKSGKRGLRCVPSVSSISAALRNAAAADAWGIGGRHSKFARLQGPPSFDPIRDGSRRRALGATWDMQRSRVQMAR